MERAHRLAPQDATVALSLGAMLLERGAAGRAAPLLEGVARGSASPDAWIALAACQLALQAEAACLEALGQALRSRVVGPALAGLATRIVERFGGPGWCGLEWDAQGRGRVQLGPGRAGRITLDGVPVRGAALPARWRRGRWVEVEGFVGSPLPVQALIGVQGFVWLGRSGLEGWAWYPGDPERNPTVFVRGATGRLIVAAVVPAEGLDGLPPLARPRRFGIIPSQRRMLSGWWVGGCGGGGHADDTVVPVLEPGLGRTRTARLWVYVRDDRPFASPDPAAVFYRYTPDRRASTRGCI